MGNTPSKKKSKNRPLPLEYAAPPNPDPNKEYFSLDIKTLKLHPVRNPITGALPKMPKYDSGFISSGYESGGDGRKRYEQALKATSAEFKAQHKAARESAIAARRGGNSGGPSHPGAFARGGSMGRGIGRGIGRGGMMHVPPGGPGMNSQGFQMPKLNTGRGQVLPGMSGMLPNMMNMNFAGQHMPQQFEQPAPEPQQGLFGNAQSEEEEQDSNNFNQGNFNNGSQQHQQNDSSPIWGAKKGKGPLDGWGEDNIAAPKQPPAGGHFGGVQGGGRESTTTQGGGNFGSTEGGGGTYSTRVGGGGNGSQQKGSQHGGKEPAPVPQDTDDPLWHAQNAQYQQHRQSGQAHNQPQNQRQPSPAPTVQSTYQTSFSTDRTARPNPPPQHEHQEQQQAPPSSSKSQTNPLPTSIHPKGDDRWPPPGSPVDRPIYLLEKYWYRLLHNNPAPEVSQLRKETNSRVNSSWQRYKKEQKPDDDPRLFMIWAMNTSKMKEISKGPRGDVYLLQQDHEYVAGCALAVEGWEKERKKKNTNFGVGNTRWRILGVGEKEYRGCLLLVKENLK